MPQRATAVRPGPRARATTENDDISSSRTKRPKDRADRILAAAAKLFGERGFHAVSLEEIGDAVGISGPAVYRHFPSKEALLTAAFERAIDQIHSGYLHAKATTRSVEERLAALVHYSIGFSIEDRNLFSVYLREALGLGSDVLGRKAQEAEDIWDETLRTFRPELTPLQALVMQRALATMVWNVCHFQPQLSRSRIDEAIASMAADMLRADLSESAASDVRPRRRRRRPVDPDGGTLTPTAAVGGWVARRASRRETILIAAIQLCRRHGFSGVGIDDIGREAGITGPGVYRYFQSKDEILAAVFNRASELLSVAAGRSLASARDARDALDRLVDSYVETVLEQPDLFAVYINEHRSLSPEAQLALRRDQRDFVEDWVGVLREVRPDLPRPEARTVVQAAVGLVHCYAQAPDFQRIPVDEAFPLFASLTRAVLLDG